MEPEDVLDAPDVEVEVEAVVVEAAPEPPAEDSVVVVVEDAPAPPAPDAEAAMDMGLILGSLTERVGQLEALVAALAEQVQSAATVADIALEVAGDAEEAVADVEPVVDEIAADTMDEAPDMDGDGKPDDVPDTARRHWLYRTLDEWRK